MRGGRRACGRLTAAVWLALTAGVGDAFAAKDPVPLRLERALGDGRAPGTTAGDVPSFGRAEKIEGVVDQRTVFEGRAELRSEGSVLRADRIVYTPPTDTLDARGSVRLFRDGALFTGPELTYEVDAQRGRMPDAQFSYAPRQVQGSAGLMEFLEPGHVRLTDAIYSSCTRDDMAWWVQAEKLDIDNNDELAVARNGRLYFMDVPILASPYFQFPLGDRRRSGVLTPSFGINSRLGFESTVPVYWDIAPNRDATFAPRIMSRRGVLLQNEFRYLEPTVRGRVQYDLLPNDRTTGGQRQLTSTQHEWVGRSGLAAGINFNEVSDDKYFADFGSNIVVASQSILPQEGFLSFGRTYYNTALRVTKNQTLQDPLAPVTKPYERIPQVTFNALNTNWRGFDVNLATEAVRFEHPSLESGTRYIVNPSVSYPWLAPGWFVVPKVQWHATRYELEEQFRPNAANRSRALPIASLDAGLVFERDGRWLGQEVTQTLEPRLYYSYIPFREQNTLPNFDSALADFNFAQLFSENVFVGGDRIAEAEPDHRRAGQPAARPRHRRRAAARSHWPALLQHAAARDAAGRTRAHRRVLGPAVRPVGPAVAQLDHRRRPAALHRTGTTGACHRRRALPAARGLGAEPGLPLQARRDRAVRHRHPMADQQPLVRRGTRQLFQARPRLDRGARWPRVQGRLLGSALRGAALRYHRGNQHHAVLLRAGTERSRQCRTGARRATAA
jgi:LPS-assembly protein